MITVSVPGKIHLMGEHAVVYGKPALLAAVNIRLTVTIRSGKSEYPEYVREILTIVKKHFHLTRLPDMDIEITSKIPPGYHLGSSAAVAVGVTAAACYFLKQIWNPQLFNQLAYEAEKIKHGNPSGGDNTTVTMGGLIWYRKELEFLKSIWQLPFQTKLKNFYLLDTGKPYETTGEMVAYVAKRNQPKADQPLAGTLQKTFDENEVQTKRVAMALKENDETLLIDAIRKGQRSLEAMGVVSNKVIPLIRRIEKTGGAAKILGGGGREAGVGYLLVYTKKPEKNYVPITLGEEGVRLEH